MALGKADPELKLASSASSSSPLAHNSPNTSAALSDTQNAPRAPDGEEAATLRPACIEGPGGCDSAHSGGTDSGTGQPVGPSRHQEDDVDREHDDRGQPPAASNVCGNGHRHPHGDEHDDDLLPTSTVVLRLRGLPFAAGPDDVHAFFAGFPIDPSPESVVVVTQGFHRGEGYVRFVDATTCAAAHAACNKKNLGDRYIELYASTVGALELQRSAQEQLLSEKRHYIRLRGLPFQASEGNIREFLAPLGPQQVQSVHLCTGADGRFNGYGLVELATEEAVEFALQHLNRGSIGSRYIEVFPSSMQERDAVLHAERRRRRQAGPNSVNGAAGGSSNNNHHHNHHQRQGAAPQHQQQQQQQQQQQRYGQQQQHHQQQGGVGQGAHGNIGGATMTNGHGGFCSSAPQDGEGYAPSAMKQQQPQPQQMPYPFKTTSREAVGDWAQQQQQPHPQPMWHDAHGAHHNGSPQAAAMWGGGRPSYPVVRIRGLPFSANESTIADFLHGVNIPAQGVHMVYNADERPTGEAFIEVCSEADVQAALALHHHSLGRRYIEVFRSSQFEMHRLQMGDGAAAPPPQPANGFGYSQQHHQQPPQHFNGNASHSSTQAVVNGGNVSSTFSGAEFTPAGSLHGPSAATQQQQQQQLQSSFPYTHLPRRAGGGGGGGQATHSHQQQQQQYQQQQSPYYPPQQPPPGSPQLVYNSDRGGWHHDHSVPPIAPYQHQHSSSSGNGGTAAQGAGRPQVGAYANHYSNNARSQHPQHYQQQQQQQQQQQPLFASPPTTAAAGAAPPHVMVMPQLHVGQPPQRSTFPWRQ